MRKIFISHPYKDNPQKNIEKAHTIAKYVFRRGMLPLNPLDFFRSCDEKARPGTREAIMQVCFRMIDIADEVWLFGESSGCLQEAKYAKARGKPVRRMYEKVDWKALMEDTGE